MSTYVHVPDFTEEEFPVLIRDDTRRGDGAIPAEDFLSLLGDAPRREGWYEMAKGGVVFIGDEVEFS